jgi:hypothetical protein
LLPKEIHPNGGSNKAIEYDGFFHTLFWLFQLFINPQLYRSQ